MPFFLVRIRRTIEFENVYEADYQPLAEELAKLECNHHAEIVDEQIIAEVVQEAEVVS